MESLSNTSNYTLSAWFLTSNSTSAGSNRLQNAIYSESYGGFQHDFGVDGGKLTWHHYGSSWEKKQGATTVSDGVWHHGVLVHYSDTTIDIYLDGSLDLDGASGYASNDFKIDMIGKNYTATTFNGNICQAGVWSKALTQAQVNRVMERTFEEFNADDKTDLVSYWALDEALDEFPAIKTTVSDLVTTTLGSDLLLGRGFTNNDDTFWTIEAGGSGSAEITGGELVFIGRAGGYRVKRATLTPEFTVGRTYKIQVEVTDYTSGACFIDVNQTHLSGTSSYDYFWNTSANRLDAIGVHTFYWTASAISSQQIAITPATTTTMKLANFTVQEVNGNTGTLI